MKDELTDTAHFERDEMSLHDLWRILSAQKKWVIGIPIVFVFLALAAIFFSEPKWEATAVIQIGQNGQSGGQGQLIEPPARAIERIKLKSFEDDVLTTLKIPLRFGGPIAELFRSSLSLKLLGTTELIQVRVRGYSKEQAETWARAITDNIKSVHERLTQPTVERLDKQLVQLNKQMQAIEDERSSLSKIVSTRGARNGDSKFPENLLLSNLLIAKDAELRDFEMRRFSVNEQLTVIRTYPTSLVDRVYVPEKPASPKKLLTVLVAAIVGLILGIIVAFLSHYWHAGEGQA
jgi:capsular polysaccharide biosynthesis protein